MQPPLLDTPDRQTWLSSARFASGETRKRNVSKIPNYTENREHWVSRLQEISTSGCFCWRWDAVTLIGAALRSCQWGCRASHPSVTLNWEILTNLSPHRGAVPADVTAQDRSRAPSPRLVVVCVTKGRHLLATNWLDICMKCGHPVGGVMANMGDIQHQPG